MDYRHQTGNYTKWKTNSIGALAGFKTNPEQKRITPNSKEMYPLAKSHASMVQKESVLCENQEQGQ